MRQESSRDMIYFKGIGFMKPKLTNVVSCGRVYIRMMKIWGSRGREGGGKKDNGLS